MFKLRCYFVGLGAYTALYDATPLDWDAQLAAEEKEVSKRDPGRDEDTSHPDKHPEGKIMRRDIFVIM